MVKVKSCLSLCPIPDPKSFLGLSEDSVPDSLIVTLGKNLVLRTKTSDLQQLTSWNIRDHLTAPVVYDKYDDRYIGIFNHKSIKFWSKNEHNYEKAKTYKFTSKLHSTLTQANAGSILVFSNGSVQPFTLAIQLRKQAASPVIQSDESIIDAYVCTFNVVALIVANENTQVCHKLYLVSIDESKKINEIDLKNKNHSLVSHCFISNETDSTLLTFWSDGNICSIRLDTHLEPEFPGLTLMNIKNIKTTQPIAMQSINSKLLVLYGCDPSEEGALLLIVDTKLQAVVCRHYFKMYTKPPRLWVISSNIVLSMGQYLALVPFQMTSQLLDTRINTQIPDEKVTKTVYWENDNKNDEFVTYETYEDKFKNVLIQDKNLDTLLKSLDSSAEVPDSCLLSCIQIFLKETDSVRTDLLIKVFSFPPPKSAMFKNAINFDLAVKILTFILDTDHALFNSHTSDWITCIIDAYYHRFILSEDKKTQALLQELHTVAQMEVNSLLELTEMKPKLERRLEQLKKTNKNSGLTFSSSKSYSYDVVKFY